MQVPAEFLAEQRFLNRQYPRLRICFTGHTHEQAAMEIADLTEELLMGLPPRRLPPKSVPPLRRAEVRARMGLEPLAAG
jgi:hypothetical protein